MMSVSSILVMRAPAYTAQTDSKSTTNQGMRTMKRQNRRENDGFTLIELLIVIIILAILAGVVVFAVGGITDRGTKSACKSDVKTLESAAEAYFAKNNVFPPADTDMKPGFVRSLPANAGTNYTVAYVGSTPNTVGKVTASGAAKLGDVVSGPANKTWNAATTTADAALFSIGDGGCP